MCYDGALVMPSSYAVMNEDEMMYLEGGGEFSMHTALTFIAGAIFGGIIYDVFKIACIKVGAWAALNAAGIAAIVSRTVAIGILLGIAATYGYVIVQTYKALR